MSLPIYWQGHGKYTTYFSNLISSVNRKSEFDVSIGSITLKRRKMHRQNKYLNHNIIHEPFSFCNFAPEKIEPIIAAYRMEDLIKTLSDFNDQNITNNIFTYLDKNAPDWRKDIKNSNVWKSFFEFNLKFSDWKLYAIVLDFFDIIGDDNVLRVVWNDKKCNDWYRFAAIRRLRLLDEKTYLPQYINWFRNIFGWNALFLIDELFDFDGAMNVAQDMLFSPQSNEHERKLGLEFFAKNACRLWHKYPKKVREIVINQRNYYILTDCDGLMFRKMSYLERSSILNFILRNTDENLHRKVSPFLIEAIRFHMI